MMEYTLDYQYSMNITWYLLGVDDAIAAFQAGGAIVPDIIVQHAQGNELLNSFFNCLPVSTVARLSPHLEKHFDDSLFTNAGSSPERFLNSNAEQGLFFFEKINSGPGNNSINYYLVAQPKQPLHLASLPLHIQEILLKVRVPIKFSDFYLINEGYSPWSSLFKEYFVEQTFTPVPVRKKSFLHRLFS